MAIRNAATMTLTPLTVKPRRVEGGLKVISIRWSPAGTGISRPNGTSGERLPCSLPHASLPNPAWFIDALL